VEASVASPDPTGSSLTTSENQVALTRRAGSLPGERFAAREPMRPHHLTPARHHDIPPIKRARVRLSTAIGTDQFTIRMQVFRF
jgi:hypothetical protein